MQQFSGLTSAEVQARVQQGLKNTEPRPLTKSTGQIIAENVFTLFNLINVVLAIMVFTTGSYKNMLFILIATVNTLIGIFQELRSKHQVDKMALLSHSPVTVIRNGASQSIAPADVVQGDTLQVTLGDQFPVDGTVLATEELEVDESQITGEADPISKQVGDPVTSGSFVVSGNALIQVTKVGSATFVNSLTAKIKPTQQNNSQLLRLINRIIKILTIIIVPLGSILLVSRFLHGVGYSEAILGTVAAMMGMIPEGLVLLSSVTLAVSAYHLARQHVLVRDLASIETLARVDTICLDKTGTLTSGALQFKQLQLETTQYTNAEVGEILGSLVNGIGDTNETARTLQSHFQEHPDPVTDIVPFSSARKWSGGTVGTVGKFAMGAPQFVLDLTPKQQAEVQHLAQAGNRVLALVQATTLQTNELQGTQLIAFILITDVIRPDAATTLEYLRNQGVTAKVISGDDPTTVAQIAKETKIPGWNQSVDMSQVGDDADYQELVAEHTVFGRVKPAQKERLIKALQANGHTVAMTGDGVNDILALRQSNCGIAMASGNESTKSIADFVLMNSNFSALINVLKEGRRVINNIDSIASLYLIKTMFSVMLSVLFLFLAKSYPFEPIQLTPINSLMVGIPSFLLALAPAFHPIRDRFIAGITGISLPSALTVVINILVIDGIGSWLHWQQLQLSTLSVLVTGFVCWQALILVSRPLNPYKTAIIAGSITLFLITFVVFRHFFGFASLFSWPLGVIGVVLILLINPLFLGLQRVVHWVTTTVSALWRNRRPAE
ncbi:HAD-IC family P-type ATPase [Fructilactobacillus myrtifloralis]|uniref:HAD-IC family P-type ATPase n=1 Tax=Fructilactobacillus myrtifloralis TaxID=2940301 RepID=A0ABY5BMU3_9LACO|nr:HAD-IC family P-type ATPase [Fructilactobacillus myrtifloralis]USS84550.1 HAD-IC family P-type ATPase [Fructilactobacillus myrtifloralis]